MFYWVLFLLNIDSIAWNFNPFLRCCFEWQMIMKLLDTSSTICALKKYWVYIHFFQCCFVFHIHMTVLSHTWLHPLVYHWLCVGLNQPGIDGWFSVCKQSPADLMSQSYCSVDKLEIWYSNMGVMWNCYLRTTLTAQSVNILWWCTFFKKEENVATLQEGLL